MPSTYTTNLGIEKIETGTQSGTWGDTTNTNLDLIDEAVNGIVTVTLASAGTSGSPNTLAITDGASSNGRNKYIEFNDGSDLGATAYVQLTPNDAEKIVFIRNSLSGGQNIIIFQGTYNASNDFEIPNGKDVVLKFNGGGTGATVTVLQANEKRTGSFEVDNLKLDGNTLSATDTNGNVNITASGTGYADVTGTGQLKLPVGTTAQRSGSAASGMIRFNSTLSKYEGYDGSAWGQLGGGATGGGSDEVFVENDQTVTSDYTIGTNKNAISTGPITINSGVTVTVPSGSNWVVL